MNKLFMRQESSKPIHFNQPGKNSMKRYFIGSVIFLSLSSVSAVCLAQMYKCVDPNGHQVFSDKPCGANTQVHVVHNTNSAGYDSSSTTLTDNGYRPSVPSGQPYGVIAENSHRTVETRNVGHVVVVERRRDAPVKQTSHHSDK